MAEQTFIVIARIDSSGADDLYYRGPGTGMFNKDAEWVGSMRWTEAKPMIYAEAEAVVRTKQGLMPTRKLVIRPA